MADRYDLVRFKNAQDFGGVMNRQFPTSNPCQLWKRNRANFGNGIAPTLETESRQLWKRNRANFGSKTVPSLEVKPRQVWKRNRAKIIKGLHQILEI